MIFKNNIEELNSKEDVYETLSYATFNAYSALLWKQNRTKLENFFTQIKLQQTINIISYSYYCNLSNALQPTLFAPKQCFFDRFGHLDLR